MNSTLKNVALLTALGVGFALGIAASHLSAEVQAEVRGSSQRKPVPSGAQQSVVVLRKMATTLESIDGRLARIEAAVETISKSE